MFPVVLTVESVLIDAAVEGKSHITTAKTRIPARLQCIEHELGDIWTHTL